MDLFPYVVATLTAVGLGGAFFGIWRALEFAAELRGHVGYLTRRVTTAEASQQLLEAAVRRLQETCERHEKALERQAGELREHRLSLPPPRVVPQTPVPISGVQTSDDWRDCDRDTVARPSSPPPLPAFGRPTYMSRG